MKIQGIKKQYLVLGLVVVFVVIVIIILAVMNRNVSKKARETDPSKISKVTYQENGTTLTIGRDGQVELKNRHRVSFQSWSKDKIDIFFSYLGENYLNQGSFGSGDDLVIYINGQSYGVDLDDDEEIIDVIIDDVGGGDGGGDDGDGEDISDYFSPPTPAPTSTPPGDGDDGDPECLYWKLSYCVRQPSPTPVPTSPPAEGGVLPPECWENTFTGRTVITNELCVQEPE